VGFVDISDSDAIAEPMELRVKYKIGKQIGEGNFAVVKECTEKYVFIVCFILQTTDASRWLHQLHQYI